MSTRSLLILAGYQGVGKSTLLRRCLDRRIPLFGLDQKQTFLDFKAPQSEREWELDVSEIVLNRFWFSEAHLDRDELYCSAVSQALFHFDILQLVLLGSANGQRNLRERDPRLFFEKLNRKDENANIICGYTNRLLSMEWSQVVINTLVVPYSEACKRWNTKRFIDKRYGVLFSGTNLGAECYYSIYKAWFSAIAKWPITQNLFCNNQNGRLAIKRMESNQGYQSNLAD